MEVVHEGLLERCITDSKKAEWKKGYYVFRKRMPSGSKTFEFFKDSNWKKQEPKGVVNLFGSYSVNIVDNTKKKYMFELTTVDKTYELYANSEASRQKWVDVLNDGLVVSFNVVLIESPSNAYQHVKDFHGTCQLQISDSTVTLRSNTAAKSVTWKFSFIRRYKSNNGAFVIEVGRKSVTGEGEFRFETANPVELFDVLDKAVKERSKAKGIEGRGHSVIAPTLPSVDISARKGLTPPNSSPKNRSYSDQSNQSAAIEQPDNEYSHIHSITNQHAKVRNEVESDYDKLFSNRMVNHRRSEPSIRPNHLSLFDNNKRITSNTQISVAVPEVDNDEVYMDMAGGNEPNTKTNSPERKQRPLPVPRTKPVGSPVSTPPPMKPPLRKTNSTPTEENTYDSPAATSPLRTHSEKQPKDYDQLFNHINNNITDAPNYSHLNHMHDSVNMKNVPSPTIIEDSVYQMPKALSKAAPAVQNVPPSVGNPMLPKLAGLPKVLPSVPALTKAPAQQTQNQSPPSAVKKVPLKPSRPAPLVPVQAPPSSRENRKSFSPTSPGAGSVILKLKRNLTQVQHPVENDDDDNEALYSCPSSQPLVSPPVEYNQVGDIIGGEYRNTEDIHGYVKVPNETDEGDIYQVPRGEKVVR